MIEKDFLKNFEQRMKFVGRYALLCSNSFGKQQWKDYGIETRDEQMNMLFTLLLFIMEYSLREENCTMDDIAAFVEDISYEYHAKKLSFEQSRDFARFMVEDILGNSGSSMYLRLLTMKNGHIRKSTSVISTTRSCIWRVASEEHPIT